MEIDTQEVYWRVLLCVYMLGWGEMGSCTKEDWSEGQVELWCSHNEVLSQTHRKLELKWPWVPILRSDKSYFKNCQVGVGQWLSVDPYTKRSPLRTAP